MSPFVERIVTAATVVAGVMASVAIGYGLGKDTNDGLLNFLREENQAVEKTNSDLQGEVSSLKLALQAKSGPPSSPTTPISGAAGTASTAQGSLATKPPAQPNEQQVVVAAGQTARPFDGKILISLVAIAFDGRPSRYQVSATIDSPGKQSKTVSNVDVGFAVAVNGYEVRVLATDGLSATFLVTLLAP